MMATTKSSTETSPVLFETLSADAASRLRLLATRREPISVELAGIPFSAAWNAPGQRQASDATLRFTFLWRTHTLIANVSTSDMKALLRLLAPFGPEDDDGLLHEAAGAVLCECLCPCIGPDVVLVAQSANRDPEVEVEVEAERKARGTMDWKIEPITWALQLIDEGRTLRILIFGSESSPGILDHVIKAHHKVRAAWSASLPAIVSFYFPSTRIGVDVLHSIQLGDVISSQIPMGDELSCAVVASGTFAASAVLRGLTVTVTSSWSRLLKGVPSQPISRPLISGGDPISSSWNPKTMFPESKTFTRARNMQEQFMTYDSEPEAEAEMTFEGFDDGEFTDTPDDLVSFSEVELEVVFEAGRAVVPINTLETVDVGYVFSLHGRAPGSVDVLVNGRRFARGQIVDVDGFVGFRITQVAR